jgi:hypothetical protein
MMSWIPQNFSIYVKSDDWISRTSRRQVLTNLAVLSLEMINSSPHLPIINSYLFLQMAKTTLMLIDIQINGENLKLSGAREREKRETGNFMNILSSTPLHL